MPALLVFLYAFYRLVKDDYIFIRKGISIEQSFDSAFITLWVSLFFSRLFFLMFHWSIIQNIFLDFFSTNHGGFSLTGGILGGVLTVYLLGKYKRVPLGRLSDFLSLSFLYSLPLLFLTDAFLVTKNSILSVFLDAIVYFILLLFFVQFLYPKIMNRTIKEGILALLFLLSFSVIALITSLLMSLKHIQNVFNFENSILLLLFIASLVLFIKQENASHTRRTIV